MVYAKNATEIDGGCSWFFSNIVTKMTIEKNPPTREAFRPSNQIQFDEDGRGYTIERDASRGRSGIKRYVSPCSSV